ncbi:MAG: hypothetical protein EBZ36_02155 [Acidobacteria bacterium]|nr:hypothetical protein [Acidobacteriota bacterium]
MSRESNNVDTRGEETGVYPDAVRKLSENWRQLANTDHVLDGAPDGVAVGGERAGRSGALRQWRKHHLPLGIGIGLLLVALLTVLGGLAFLVWNAGR